MGKIGHADLFLHNERCRDDVDARPDVPALSAGNVYNCAIRQGDIYCWGDDFADVPTLWDGSGDWAMVSVEDNAELAIKDDGTLWNLPSAQLGADTDWETVDAGFSSYCALKTDGSLHCDYSLLGGDEPPERVGTETGFTALAFEQTFGCATKAGGELWCWGDNPEGEHGDDSLRRLAPVAWQ